MYLRLPNEPAAQLVPIKNGKNLNEAQSRARDF